MKKKADVDTEMKKLNVYFKQAASPGVYHASTMLDFVSFFPSLPFSMEKEK